VHLSSFHLLCDYLASQVSLSTVRCSVLEALSSLVLCPGLPHCGFHLPSALHWHAQLLLGPTSSYTGCALLRSAVSSWLVTPPFWVTNYFEACTRVMSCPVTMRTHQIFVFVLVLSFPFEVGLSCKSHDFSSFFYSSFNSLEPFFLHHGRIYSVQGWQRVSS